MSKRQEEVRTLPCLVSCQRSKLVNLTALRKLNMDSSKTVASEINPVAVLQKKKIEDHNNFLDINIARATTTVKIFS